MSANKTKLIIYYNLLQTNLILLKKFAQIQQMRIFYIIFAILLITIFIRCQDKYIASNLFEMQTLKLVDYQSNPQSNGSRQVAKTINFQSLFSTIPYVLLGICELDFSITIGQSQFNLQVNSVNANSVNLQFTKQGSYTFYNFGIVMLAIQDSNIKIQQFSLKGSDGMNQKKNFQLPTKASIQKQSFCFLTGLSYTSSNNQLQFGVNVSSFTQDDYTITIVTQDISVVNTINVNCIEYYSMQQGDYSMITEIQNLNFQNLNIGGSPSSQQKDVTRNSQIEGTTSVNFFGISTMKNTYQNPNSIRIQVANSFTTNKNTIQVQTRDSSDIINIDIGFFNYSIYNCFHNEGIKKINFSQNQNCVQVCPDGNYQQIYSYYSICVPNCDNNQYSLNKVCYNSYPNNSYCSADKMCQQCKSPYCQQCESNLEDCLQCVPDQFQLLKTCSPEKPKNAYCKIKK
ncbi:H-type lectin domain protein (macronuclear) [Tetrahymena thermophila SB210]|uniref:H-type lectin domain protein n=1 Tax=Tetrahymena thermophila (strain SB210) TaxID=312017 RepID=Q229Y4_TETTS|nr:H-type lectin domain protein [Tetrahymena thermophila SB210]EAR82103.2 H-type lectin domain protein [Tetrahymena thermophila SB210]|eukprot:XP_001029766.2 H-type lectin domain protein [Tetrahymena thermophila SB210]